MRDYMFNENEVKKHPDAFKTIKDVAKGDVAVEGFLFAFWHFSHAFDDLVDNSGWQDEKKEQAWKALNDLQRHLLSNPFVRRHTEDIRTLFTSAIARQIGGDHLSLVEGKKVHAPAVKCADVDILVHIAGLHSGWDDMIKVSKERTIDTQEDI